MGSDHLFRLTKDQMVNFLKTALYVVVMFAIVIFCGVLSAAPVTLCVLLILASVLGQLN